MKREADEYRSSGMGRGGDMGDDVDDHIGRIRLGRQIFRSFKNPVYRLYYGAMVGQWAPMNMQMMARSLLIYRLSGSAAILGAMSFANAVPLLSLALFGGVIADRVQKKYVLLVGQVASAVVSLGVALTMTLGYLSAERAGSWWILVVASVFQGTIMALMMPSRHAILPEIVGEEQLMNAVSLSMLGMNAVRFLTPALTGFLIDVFDFQAVYYAMTGLYLMSVVFMVFMPLTGTITIRGRGALADIKEGFKYLRHEAILLLILLFTLITIVLSMPYMFLMPVFTEDVLKVGATGMGLLISVSGIGAITGSIILASLPNKKRGLMLLASGAILGLVLAGFASSSSWYLSLGLIAFVGLGQTSRMTLGNTLLQYYVEDEYRGRVMSLYMMEFGLTSFGTFAAGVLAESIGVQWAVGGFAMVLFFVSVLTLVFVPRLRRLD
ncbi:MFS transporter [Chloroflexota bacterium]